MIPIAYETVSSDLKRWAHGIALCLPRTAALGQRRSCLTEIGPDTEAVRPEDRDKILFDVGVDQPQIDFCVRTGDIDLVRLLRECCGKPVFTTEAGRAILAAHPHRIVRSNLGRVEIYQKIGGDETGGVSPTGPHTHLLPKMLAAHRTHSANIPIPDDLVPCVFLYPGNPVTDALGREMPFDEMLFATFQGYLALWGSGSYLAMKQSVWRAIDARASPRTFSDPDNRLDRAGLRNAVRQKLRLLEAKGEQNPERSIAEDWMSHFEAR